MKKIYFSVISLLLLVCLCLTSPISVNASAIINEAMFQTFSSSSYILIDKDSGTVLLEKNSSDKMQVASICKLMTTLLVLEKLDKGEVKLEDEFTASEYACSMEGSQAFLDAGSKYKLNDLLKSIIIASANDSTVVMAENLAGNEQAFVKLMNDKAKVLGMHNTVYANANGLPSANQYSTAYDTSIILSEIGKYKLFNEYSNIWMDDFIHSSGRKTELVNTNRLIKYYDACKNGKTGFTDEAGYCLSSTASKNNLNLIAVVLKCKNSSDRFKESIELFNYGFANYENKHVLTKGEILKEKIKVVGGKESLLEISPESNFYAINKKGDSSEISLKFELKKEAKAPVKNGTVMGKCLVIKNGKVIGEVKITASHNIEKQKLTDIFSKISNNWGI